MSNASQAPEPDVKFYGLRGDYYSRSGTMVGPLYEQSTGTRGDWGKLSVLVREGKRILIEPAPQSLEDWAESVCQQYAAERSPI